MEAVDHYLDTSQFDRAVEAFRRLPAAARGGRTIEEFERSAFLERDLENHLAQNLDAIEPGLVLEGQGRQQPTTVGTMDLFARAANGDLVVIELKKIRASDKVFGQICRYMGWVTRNYAPQGTPVRGYIIGSEIDQKLQYPAGLSDTGCSPGCDHPRHPPVRAGERRGAGRRDRDARSGHGADPERTAQHDPGRRPPSPPGRHWGPAQPILRPVEIERPDFGRELLQAATFGEHAIFDHARGSSAAVRDGILLLGQDNGAAVVLDERGSVRLSIPAKRGGGHMPAIIDENVSAALDRALGYATWLLEKIDAVHRLSRIVVVASLADAGMGAWRTQREQDASPNSMTYSHGFNSGERPPVHFQPPDRPRAAIGFDQDRMVEDLKTLLRRQWQ
ncbi:endonuclease NucS domain-containing protein [Sphingomonas bacterium]|uniref:endonuclease NucS domain-containing protein n=1 Tax=Sphingomonas bacterium TaxID=1895847 RepID=UPI001576A06B|nr:endonuclease NucS domain-containing protein [Sphingomonas bacterium]